VLSPMRGPPRANRPNKRISVLRSIYRTLARCSLKTYATEVPEFLDAGPPPGLFPALITCGVGWLLFGIATLRARVYPRWTTILLIVGAVIFVVPLPLTGIVLSVSVAWLGFHLFRGGDAAAEARTSPRVS
jgi:hypothetical protein